MPESTPPSPAEARSLQGQVAEQKSPHRKAFGTFSGVFVPTLLTILGVIMYLREGWVVGNAGLLGAWLVILLSFGITGFTGLSLSSIATNIRVGAGGAFNIISQSLGLEVGGSVGVPLFLSQALAVSMYIFGFRAGWLWIFPDHSPLLVDLGVFALIFVIGFISAGLAFKIQYLILAVIVASLISVLVSVFQGSMVEEVTWWGSFQGSPEGGFQGIGFWAVFAVFFPASTGIMAGANMSGELENPRRNIPVGTLSAIGISLVIYLVLAYWLARVAGEDALVENYTIIVDRAAWGPVVLAGLLGATFSSALSSLVGAPRILQALGQHRILPAGGWLSRRAGNGEPRNAFLLTGLIVLGALMLRDLNAVAPLITLFFLITYAMINVVVFLEQSMGLVSFRPLLRIPRFVSGLGALGCIFAMFVVNPAFSLVAVAVVLGIHGILIRRHLEAPFGDVRSGLFVALAEWAAQKVGSIPASRERTWKANLLVPVEDPHRLRHRLGLYRDLAFPNGFVKVVGLTDVDGGHQLQLELEDICRDLEADGVRASGTVISSATFAENLGAGVEAFGGTFFRPNVLVLTLPEEEERRAEIGDVLEIARRVRMGAALLVDPGGSPYQRQSVNVWFRDGGVGWDLNMKSANQDLAILLGYKLKENWKARFRMLAMEEDGEQEVKARKYLEDLAEMGRLPDAEILVARRLEAGGFDAPRADLNLMPLPEEPDFNSLRELTSELGSPCLFTLDSGKESALA